MPSEVYGIQGLNEAPQRGRPGGRLLEGRLPAVMLGTLAMETIGVISLTVVDLSK